MDAVIIAIATTWHHPLARSHMLLPRLAAILALICLGALSGAADPQPGDPSEIRLKDFRPVSIYQVPQTTVRRARYPVIDFHTHDYAKTADEVDAWVAAMDAANVARSIVLTFTSGDEFAALVARYGRHPDRFELWCDFDYAGYDQPGWSERAIAELERCHQLGARGLGELTDKGMGFKPRKTTATLANLTDTTVGMHINDERMKPLLAACARLHMPINIHVAEDAWMYQPADVHNDGLMNGAKWKVDLTRKGILDHDQLIATLDDAVGANPATTFIACHLANCCSDLSQLARLFDAHPNLYADIGARYGEIAPIPRYVHAFLEKYHDRILYGTDNHYTTGLYPVSFRILETADEHFYETGRFGYHWPLYGLALSDETLKAIYNGNSERVLVR